MKSKFFSSPKTTLAAIVGFISLVMLQISYALDADPETVFDWAVIAYQIPILFGLLFSRDNDKSSQDVGVRPAEKQAQAQAPVNATAYGSRNV